MGMVGGALGSGGGGTTEGRAEAEAGAGRRDEPPPPNPSSLATDACHIVAGSCTDTHRMETVCFAFRRKGECRNGDACQYLHIAAPAGVASAVHPAASSNWTCHNCAASVVASKLDCYRCKAPRATAAHRAPELRMAEELGGRLQDQGSRAAKRVAAVCGGGGGGKRAKTYFGATESEVDTASGSPPPAIACVAGAAGAALHFQLQPATGSAEKRAGAAAPVADLRAKLQQQRQPLHYQPEAAAG